MAKLCAAVIATRFFDDRKQSARCVAIGQSVPVASFHRLLVDRNASQFVTPYGSDAVTVFVQEDAIAPKWIMRQGRAQIDREPKQKCADATTPDMIEIKPRMIPKPLSLSSRRWPVQHSNSE